MLASIRLMRSACAHTRKTSNVFLAPIYLRAVQQHTTQQRSTAAQLYTDTEDHPSDRLQQQTAQLIAAIQGVALPVNADSEL